MRFFVIVLLLSMCNTMFAQQMADTLYRPPLPKPEYQIGHGPMVFIDEGHHNFHTKNGRYKAFSNLLERDGYIVKEYKGEFLQEKLKQGNILVISNALNERNVSDWFLPTPSAFSKTEIATLENWVTNGGSLFLIADHMPMGGAAQDLAAAFDIEFTNGFVFDTIARGPSVFTKKEGTLLKNKITNGRDSTESVEKIVSFTGQGFRIPEKAEPILVLDDRYMNFLPDTAWVFSEKTKRIPMKGWSQGAYMSYGKGRVVVFGEAAMFSAQIAGPNKIKMGMNNPIAPENYQLLLNIIHWLDGKLD